MDALETLHREVTGLQKELKSKNSKLQSLSEVYHSQQQVLSLSQTLEEKLLRFMEELMRVADSAFEEVSSKTSQLRELVQRKRNLISVTALDLAGLEGSACDNVLLESEIENLRITIAPVVQELEAKNSQLRAWKKQRASRVLSQAISTPSTAAKKRVPDTPSIIDTLDQVKRVLHEEVLSPDKLRAINAKNLDVECFQKVIHSLESQIDELLGELQSANEALSAKDKLFADLEQLVAHHESERDLLAKKLESRNATLQELEERLNREVAWKCAAKTELATIQAQTANGKLKCPGESSHSAAGYLIANFFQGRIRSAKSAAFYHWACHTSATHAIEHQRKIASELSQELAVTREKFSILKRHLKKSRKFGGGVNTSRGEIGLDSILEGQEAVEDQNISI